jgi:L-alanine-DL-glutamate epimerase-like enolase superfamily enzyme
MMRSLEQRAVIPSVSGILSGRRSCVQGDIALFTKDWPVHAGAAPSIVRALHTGPAIVTDMTIAAIRTTLLRVPWPQTPWLKGHAFGDARNILVLEVETKGGIVGMGYLFSFRPGLRTVAVALAETIIPRIIGKDATAVEGIWSELWHATVTYNRGGIVTMAMSALDIALWDAIGKRAGLPLHRLWGHVRSRIPAYGSGCFRGSGGDGMIAKALHYKDLGYRAIKMQMAHTDDLRGDVDNVRRMREALGPDVAIMIDVNQGWTADTAIVMGRKIEPYDVYWLEEPVPADDFKGYMRVAEALPIRIVGGETHFTRFDLRPFFENPKIPILQPDPMRGGFTELRKIAVLADTWGLTIAPHLFPELNVQLLASIPNGVWIEDMGLSDDLFVDSVPVVDGVITVPERPGHGLSFKPEILRNCAVVP